MMDDHEIHDNSSLIELVKTGNVAKLRAVLTNDPSVLDSCRDWAGDGLLAQACWHSKVEIALLLLDEFQTNVNDKNSAGRTPLHCAADHGDKDMLRLLCDRGADMDCYDKSGKRPIDVGNAITKEYLEDRLEVQLELARMKLRDFEEADRMWEETLLKKQDSIHMSAIGRYINKAVPVHISGCQNEVLNGVYTPKENHCHCLCPVYVNRENPQFILIYQSYTKAESYTFPSLDTKLTHSTYWNDLAGAWVVMEISSIFTDNTASRSCSLDPLRLDSYTEKMGFFKPELNLDLCFLHMSCASATFPELRVEGSNGITEYENPAAIAAVADGASGGGGGGIRGSINEAMNSMRRQSSSLNLGGKPAKYVELPKRGEVSVQTEESVLATNELTRLKAEMNERFSESD